MDAPRSRPTLGQHLVAALVLAHALFLVVGSIPMAPRALAEGTQNRRVDESVAWWTERLERVGLPSAATETVIRGVGGAWTGALYALHGCTWPYSRGLGVMQGWSMFGHVRAEAAIPEIEVREASGGWRPIYVARSDEYTWRRALFDHDRTRTWIQEAGWRGPRPGWASFADWVAREVPKDFPDAVEVRVQLRAIEIPPPEELRATGALRRTHTFRVETRSL